MKRNRHDNINTVYIPEVDKSGKEKHPKGSRKLDLSFIFQAMDYSHKFFVVYARRAGYPEFFWRGQTFAANMIPHTGQIGGSTGIKPFRQVGHKNPVIRF